MSEPKQPPDLPKYNLMYEIAERLSKSEGKYDLVYCMEQDKFFYYNDGIWRDIFELEIIDMASKAFNKLLKLPYSMRKQVIDNLKQILYKPLADFNRPPGWINMRNCMLNPVTREKVIHHKKFYSTIRIDYDYDPYWPCPIWLTSLDEIFEKDKDKIGILQEFFGYCLTTDTRKEKALLLLGESRTGKSTILHILRNMIGSCNCSSVALKFINNPQYTPLLINKLVNIDTDVSGKAEAFEAEFKTITSGEPVSCNQKFIATFEFNPFCKLALAANEFPRITDHSSAFYKRLILIPCDRVFEENEQNRKLKDQLIDELPGILDWAITGLERLTARGRFEMKDFMSEAISDLRDESNPTEVFFRENIEIKVSNGVEIDKGELYRRYKQWAEDNKQFVLSSVKFAQCVFRKYSQVTPKNTMNHGTFKRVWKNLQFINNNIQKGENVSWHDK